MTQDDNSALIAWTGTMFDLFQLSGKIPEFKELQNIIDNGFTILESQIFITRADMLSWPWALLISKARMIFKISWYSKSTADIIVLHKQFFSGDIELSFSIGAHCLAKCKLKKISPFPKISYELVVYYEWWN